MGKTEKMSADQDEILSPRVERLHRAVLEGQFKLVKILVEGGVDVNAYLDGKTTLMTAFIGWKHFFARRPGILYIIRYLFANGADPYLVNSSDQNCFDILESSDFNFLRVEFSLCIQQRAFHCNSLPNLTGNIYEVPSPELERKLGALSPKIKNKTLQSLTKKIMLKEKSKSIDKFHNIK